MTKVAFSLFPALVVAVLFGATAKEVNALEVGLGMSVNQHVVGIRQSEGEKEKRAEFVSGVYATPAFTLINEPSYFGSSRFGWLLELSLGSYRLTKQKDPEAKLRSYDSVIKGIFGHVNPLVFYRFGDRYRRGKQHWSLMAGFGYGLSFLTVDGSFATDYELPAFQKDVTIRGGRGYFYLPATFAKLGYYNFYTTLFSCFGGPGFVNDDYSYRLIFRTVTVGYSFEL